ncbi:MAG: YqaA family protein [Alphaproteobacteria bacterium]
MTTLSIYAGLFLAAFLAATILPMQSEALLAGLLLTKEYAFWALILVASIGNIAGAVVNWVLGRGIARFQHKRWYPLKGQALEKAKYWYQRYGRWSLLFSWVPFIGDPLTIAAGVMRERLAIFIAIVSVAKTMRYLALATAIDQI